MNYKNEIDYETIIGLQSDDIIIGLGSADKKLLATLIALFEDSKLTKRLKEKSDGLIQDMSQALDRYTKKKN